MLKRLNLNLKILNAAQKLTNNELIATLLFILDGAKLSHKLILHGIQLLLDILLHLLHLTNILIILIIVYHLVCHYYYL